MSIGTILAALGGGAGGAARGLQLQEELQQQRERNRLDAQFRADQINVARLNADSLAALRETQGQAASARRKLTEAQEKAIPDKTAADKTRADAARVNAEANRTRAARPLSSRAPRSTPSSGREGRFSDPMSPAALRSRATDSERASNSARAQARSYERFSPERDSLTRVGDAYANEARARRDSAARAAGPRRAAGAPDRYEALRQRKLKQGIPAADVDRIIARMKQQAR
jgi:hypothetical protein